VCRKLVLSKENLRVICRVLVLLHCKTGILLELSSHALTIQSIWRAQQIQASRDDW